MNPDRIRSLGTMVGQPVLVRIACPDERAMEYTLVDIEVTSNYCGLLLQWSDDKPPMWVNLAHVLSVQSLKHLL